MKMKKLLIVLFALSMLFFLSLPFTGYLIMMINYRIELFLDSKKKKIEAPEACVVQRDKAQIAAGFISNIDTLWAQMNDSLKKHPELDFDSYYNSETFLYDPTTYYKRMIRYRSGEQDSVCSKFLPSRPKEYYSAYTDTIIYSPDRKLCWAFVALTHKNENDIDSVWAYSVIGSRDNPEAPFRLYLRTFEPRSTTSLFWINHYESVAAYDPEFTYNESDVYSPKTNTPTLYDPIFFKKHPLFKRNDESVYQFELYRVDASKKAKKDNIKRFNYPF